MEKRLADTDRIMGRITRAMSAIGTMAVLLMMLLVVADIVARAFFRSPIRGAHELVEFTLIVAVFLAIPYVQHSGKNISISLLTDLFPKRAQALTQVFMCILSFAIVGLMTWQAFGYFWRMVQAGKETTVLALPVSPFQFIVAYGLLVLCIVLMLEFLSSLLRRA